MRTTTWLVPLALGLAACTTYDDPYGGQGPRYPSGQYPEPYPQPQPYPAPDPYPQPQPYPPVSQEAYRAIGTEPFWDLDIGDQLVFTDRGINLSVRENTPQPIRGTAGDIYRTRRLEVNITHVRCSDGMSDRTYPDSVQVSVDGKQYRGCGATASFFSGVSETGGQVPPPSPPPSTYPPPPSNIGPGNAIPLDKTRWRVISINNRPTPRDGNFAMQFADGRLSATLGCNGLGAGYTQNGASLDAGMIMASKMACQDMSWEQQGSAVLGDIMTVRMLNPSRILLESPSGSIELVRQ